MTRFEQLEQLADSHDIRIDLHILQEDDACDGLFVALRDGCSLILINRHRALAQRTAALAEELGHYFRSVGDLRDLNDIVAAKSEALAHSWSIDQLLPQPELQTYLENGNGTAWEVAEAADLPEHFVREAATYHARKKSQHITMDDFPPELQEAILRAADRSREEIRQPIAVPPPPPASQIKQEPAPYSPYIHKQPDKVIIKKTIPPPAQVAPSLAEQREALYARGKALYGIERDEWVWQYLFEMWFNRDSKLKCTSITTHSFKQFGKANLTTMLDRIFREYYVSLGKDP